MEHQSSRSTVNTIFIGNIALDVKESNLRDYFNPYGVISHIYFEERKYFGFIEYEQADAAYFAIKDMNGYEVFGKKLIVERPKHFNWKLLENLPVPPKTRLYISNVARDISENRLKGIFSEFGRIRTVVLVPDGNSHKGYGYVEYDYASDATEAVRKLRDKLYLSNKRIRICPAFVGGALPLGMSDKREEKRKESEGDQKEKTNTNNSKESKEDTKEVFDKTDHCTLTLKNMKRPKEITDDTWADVLVECEKFGTVERVRLIIQDDDAEFQVDFKNAKDCFNACKNLDGRSYDSNKVVAQRINKVV